MKEVYIIYDGCHNKGDKDWYHCIMSIYDNENDARKAFSKLKDDYKKSPNKYSKYEVLNYTLRKYAVGQLCSKQIDTYFSIKMYD